MCILCDILPFLKVKNIPCSSHRRQIPQQLLLPQNSALFPLTAEAELSCALLQHSSIVLELQQAKSYFGLESSVFKARLPVQDCFPAGPLPAFQGKQQCWARELLGAAVAPGWQSWTTSDRSLWCSLLQPCSPDPESRSLKRKL